MNNQGPGPLVRATFALLAASLAGTALAHVVRRHHGQRYFHHRYVGNPHLRSGEALVLDVTDSRVLYAKRPARVVPIASITKLMTTLVVAEAHQRLTERVRITRADRERARSRLPVGTWLTRAQLFHLALMASENRAAHALARNYPGGVAACVRAMNAKARALGMRHTHFVEPTGLSAHNVSTPEDLAKLVIAVSRDPIIRRYSTSHGYTIRSGRRLIAYHNTDPLVSSRWWHIKVQKTGFTDLAGMCLVMETRLVHREIVMVLLDSWGKYTRVADARRVRQWLETRFARRALQTVAAR